MEVNKLVWESSPTHCELRRASFRIPGFDCGVHGETCKHPTRGGHGRKSEEWIYLVGDGSHALSLTVFSGIYPGNHFGAPVAYRSPEAAGLEFHHAVGTDAESIRTRQIGRVCEYIEAGHCFGEPQLLYGDEVWLRLGGRADPEQAPAFWLGLEAEFLTQRRDHLAKVKAAPVQCPVCHGNGTVSKELAADVAATSDVATDTRRVP